MDDRRLQQAQQQARALQAKPAPVYRIGDRDPATGKYEMLYPDGSKATGAEKLYSAASTPGDRVLAQQRTDGTWLLSEAGSSRRRRKAAPSAMPPRVKRRSQVWVLYEFEGGLWVGGHQAVPERIGDASLIGYGDPLNIENRRAFIWGDLAGWIAQIAVPSPPEIPAKQLINIAQSGDRSTFDASTVGSLFVSNYIDFFPVGGGRWILQDAFPRAEVIGDIIDGNFDYYWQQGVWGFDGIKLGSAIKTEERANDFYASRINTFAGSIAIFGSVTAQVSGTIIPWENDSKIDLTLLWLCDRASALAIKFAGSYGEEVGSFDLLSVGDDGVVNKLSQKTFNNPGIVGPGFGQSAAFFGLRYWRYLQKWGPGADGGSVTSGSRPYEYPPKPDFSNGNLTPQSEVWYTNRRVVKVALVEAEKLKLATQNINIVEVAIDGGETITSALGFAIPPTSNILSYCGSLT